MVQDGELHSESLGGSFELNLDLRVLIRSPKDEQCTFPRHLRRALLRFFEAASGLSSLLGLNLGALVAGLILLLLVSQLLLALQLAQVGLFL